MEIPTNQPWRGECQASGKIMAVNKTLGIIYRLSGGRWGNLVKLNIIPPEDQTLNSGGGGGRRFGRDPWKQKNF